jgi:hypothetical protein
MLFDEQTHGALNELACFRLGDVRQFLAPNLARLAAKPRIGFPGIFVISKADDLLPVGEQLDLFSTDDAVRRNKIYRNLFERLVGA